MFGGSQITTSDGAVANLEPMEGRLIDQKFGRTC